MINLKNKAFVVAASLYHFKGVVLCRQEGRFAVWSVFKPKGSDEWSMTNGKFFDTNSLSEATEHFMLESDKVMPEVSCSSCGYLFSDEEDSCEECIFEKESR